MNNTKSLEILKEFRIYVEDILRDNIVSKEGMSNTVLGERIIYRLCTAFTQCMNKIDMETPIVVYKEDTNYTEYQISINRIINAIRERTYMVPSEECDLIFEKIYEILK